MFKHHIVNGRSPNGGPFNKLSTLLHREESHRGVVRMGMKEGMKEGPNGGNEPVIDQERAGQHLIHRMQHDCIDIGANVITAIPLGHGLVEYVLEVWLSRHTVERGVDELTLADLQPALDDYHARGIGFLTVELGRTLDGILDVGAVERRAQELLEGNGHQGVMAKHRLGVLRQGFRQVNLAFTPFRDDEMFPRK